MLAAAEPDGWLATSDERIRERTGRGWEAWFDRIDEWGELTHREIAKRIAAELGIDPLAWNAQAITMSYERTSTRPKSARFDWAGGESRVNAAFVAKGEASSTVSVEHRRLADPDEAERMKAFWRERLTQLAS